MQSSQKVDPYLKIGLNESYVQRLTAPARLLIDRLVKSVHSTQEMELPPTTELFARRTLKAAGLRVESSFWEILEPDFGFEVWSLDLEYLFGCGKFISLTSYSQEQLLRHSWQELFDRDEVHLRQIFMAAQKATQTGRPVLNVTAPHIVTEKISQARISLLVAVKGVFPVFFEGDTLTPVCNVALTQFKQLP